MAKIIILGEVISETKRKKDNSGDYEKRTQKASIETATCKITTELDVPPGKQYALGNYTADLEAQLKPGRFGLELPRYFDLVPAAAK